MRKRTTVPTLFASDLFKIRQLALQKLMYKELITFELIYKFRLHDLNLLQQLTSENYNTDTQTFNVTGFEHINVGNFLHDLLSEYNYKGVGSSASAHHHFLKLSKLIDKDVRYINIKKLHDIMHWTCSKCEQKYEVLAENWNIRQEPYGRVTCTNCALEALPDGFTEKLEVIKDYGIYNKMESIRSERKLTEDEQSKLYNFFK